jgi:hypothetical protein
MLSPMHWLLPYRRRVERITALVQVEPCFFVTSTSHLRFDRLRRTLRLPGDRHSATGVGHLPLSSSGVKLNTRSLSLLRIFPLLKSKFERTNSHAVFKLAPQRFLREVWITSDIAFVIARGLRYIIRSISSELSNARPRLSQPIDIGSMDCRVDRVVWNCIKQIVERNVRRFKDSSHADGFAGYKAILVLDPGCLPSCVFGLPIAREPPRKTPCYRINFSLHLFV